MRILSLRLRGFIGIQKGLGLPEISLDFSNLSGLIALSGENGGGKTTVIDNLSPYRQLASRAGALQRHVFLRDSLKELYFEFAGDIYRTLIKIDSDSDRTEGYIWKNDTPQVNGKVSEYDKYITGLFGSSQLFFSSVFCAQNAEKISDMTTSELKKLFSEFLRLDRLVEYENTAKQCVTLLTAKAADLHRGIMVAQESLTGMGAQEKKLADIESALNETNLLIKSMVSDLKEAERDLEDARVAAANNTVIRQRVQDLRAGAIRIEKEIAADKAASESQLSGLREKAKKIMAEITAAEYLLESKDQVSEAVYKMAGIESAIKEHTETLKRMQENIEELNQPLHEVGSELSAAKAKLSEIISDPSIRILEAKIKGRHEKMADLDKKDPACTSTTCSFIVGALAAKAELTELEPKLESLKALTEQKIKSAQSSVDILSKEFVDLTNQVSRAMAARKAKEIEGYGLKSELNKYQPIAAEQSKIAVAEARLNDLQQRKEDSITEGKRIRTTWDERIGNKTAELQKIQNEMETVQKSIDQRADNKVADIQSIIASHRAHIENETAGMARQEAQISALKKDLEIKADVENRLKARIVEHSKVTNDIADWTYLKNACSKDGLRALEIDSVAPIISGYANDILCGTFGPSHTVKLRTQDENNKEILDVISIREDGSEVNIENLSGGEQVWSLKALRLAMLLISKEKSGRDFKTIFCDENDGALSTDKAINFTQMYRSLMKIAGIENCFFISHKGETIALADHVMKFGNGGVLIN